MSDKRLVWDLPLRLFHWLLVLSLAASWYTAEQSRKGEYIELFGELYAYAEVHYWLGYWALGLIVFRLLWGFIGPRHARFSNFLVGPSGIIQYAKSFFRRDSKRYPGHNPLGALSVIALLLAIGAQAVSGLFIIDNTEFYPAPFYPTVETATAKQFASFHFWNFDMLLWLAGLHVVTVLFYLFYKHQNLIGAMITGRKPGSVVPAAEAITSSQVIKAVILALLVWGAVWLLLAQAPIPTFDDYEY